MEYRYLSLYVLQFVNMGGRERRAIGLPVFAGSSSNRYDSHDQVDNVSFWARIITVLPRLCDSDAAMLGLSGVAKG